MVLAGRHDDSQGAGSCGMGSTGQGGIRPQKGRALSASSKLTLFLQHPLEGLLGQATTQGTELSGAQHRGNNRYAPGPRSGVITRSGRGLCGWRAEDRSHGAKGCQMY